MPVDETSVPETFVDCKMASDLLFSIKMVLHHCLNELNLHLDVVI